MSSPYFGYISHALLRTQNTEFRISLCLNFVTSNKLILLLMLTNLIFKEVRLVWFILKFKIQGRIKRFSSKDLALEKVISWYGIQYQLSFWFLASTTWTTKHCLQRWTPGEQANRYGNTTCDKRVVSIDVSSMKVDAFWKSYDFSTDEQFTISPLFSIQ